MPRTNFGFGTPITPEFLNKVAYPKITGLSEDGHLDLITNSQLSNQPGQVLFDLYDNINRLSGSRFGVSGLVVTIRGARVLSPAGEIQVIETQNVNIPDNSINWVWLDHTGTYRVTNFNPPSGVRSCRVSTGSGQITQIVDLRYDYIWLPNPATLDVFGGSATSDYIVAANTTISLSGVVNCRNFVLPASSTIDVTGFLTIRASGSTEISGTIRTANTVANQIRFQAEGTPTISVTSGSTPIVLGNNYANPVATPVTNRNKAESYGGTSGFYLSASTSVPTRITGCSYTSSATYFTPGCNGAVLTINSAGPVRLFPTAVINCNVINTTTLNIPSTALNAFGAGAGSTETWLAEISIIPPQPTAGTIVIQSSTSVIVDAGANLSVVGANKNSGRRFNIGVTNGVTNAPATLGWFHVGGGGGGNIHFQAPVVSGSPSATYNVSPGSHSFSSNPTDSINGPGSGGRGYTASTNTAPQNGSVTTVQSYPIEF